MSEADESYDGAMKRAHRAEATVRGLEGFLDCKDEPCAIVGGWCLRHAKARIVYLEEALRKDWGPIALDDKGPRK